MNQKDHWQQVYSTRQTDNLGWYKPHLTTSMSWIKALNLAPEDPVIDVGGGASTLVDDLLELDYQSVSVLDISDHAISAARQRLAKKAAMVTWLVGDITSIDLPTNYYKLWHDRAVFHFLTEQEQQQKYRHNLLKSLKPGGYLVIGTFAPEAPAICSGLPVQRYSPEQLVKALGEELELMRHHKELHITPGGVEQMYLYCQFRKTT
jgi:ubiquinone/menaquinone biosynthesis C-methylase UbiE